MAHSSLPLSPPCSPPALLPPPVLLSFNVIPFQPFSHRSVFSPPNDSHSRRAGSVSTSLSFSVTPSQCFHHRRVMHPDYSLPYLFFSYPVSLDSSHERHGTSGVHPAPEQTSASDYADVGTGARVLVGEALAARQRGFRGEDPALGRVLALGAQRQVG